MIALWKRNGGRLPSSRLECLSVNTVEETGDWLLNSSVPLHNISKLKTNEVKVERQRFEGHFQTTDRCEINHPEVSVATVLMLY